MRFSLPSLKKLLRRLLPKNGFKKPVVGGLKTSSKLIAASILMGGGEELATHMAGKAQGVDNGSKYVLMEDFGPSFARFNSIESSTDGSTKI